MKEKINVSTLRFSEFDGEWQKFTLKQVSTKNISYGVVQTGDKDLSVPCVRVVDLTSGSLDRETFIKTSESISQSYKKTILESGELMVALRGVIGLTRAVPKGLVGCNLTRGIARISPNQKKFSSQFVEQVLNTPKSAQRFDKLKNGSALKEISIGELNKYSAVYPLLPEQQKIAAFLSKVDEKISLLSEKKAKLTEYKKGVMQQLFNGKWQQQDGKLVFIPPTLRFKADDGSEFPDWENTQLKDSCEFKDNKRLPLSSGERQQRQGQYRYYGASGVIDYVDDFLFDGEFVLLGEDGANIITRTTPLAFVVSGKFWVNNHAHVLKAHGNTYFLAQSLEKLNYEQYNSGTAQPKLNAAICKKINLNMPCLLEQTKIANFLMVIDKKIELTSTELDKAKQWKKGLLQQMFV